MNVDSDVISRVLNSLRRWGWEAGAERLKAELASAGMSGIDACPWLLPLVEARAGALEQLPPPIHESPELRPLLGWGHAGQALVAMRHGDYPRAHQHLDQAFSSGADGDPMLRATCAHYRGAVYHHAGQPDAALVQLHDALELFGTEHFVAGRVLDTLGMVYAGTDDYATARELYEAAIRCKERCQDKRGLAVSHGQLGRLALNWGDLSEAERHFRTDLDLALRLEDERGVALMYGSLGQVALSDGRPAEAAALLDESIRRAHLGGWTITEGYARKDRARTCLLLHEREEAEHQLNAAEGMFQSAGFAEGLAHLYRVRAQLWQTLGKYDEAERLLMRALAHFESMRERAQVARTQRELAQLMGRRGASAVLVSEGLLRALESAERCRRHILVREIEAELRAVDEVAYMRHTYQRARGRGVRVDTASLLSGERETITVLFLDLESSTEYMRGTDPEVILLTLNQMMAKLADVLSQHEVTVTAYLGDGFMALVRGRDHARRGVTAALHLAAVLQEFNRPRLILGLPTLRARTGLSTGEVCLGNVGTYAKMDFTALGTTVNIGARVQAEARDGRPCLSQDTYELVSDHFEFAPGNPRTVDLKGLGIRQVWDAVRGKNSPLALR